MRVRIQSAIAFLCVILAVTALASSCSRLAGWGLVLWATPESGLKSGDVVPVYFKSNITKTWAVGSPRGKEKAELALWRLELYPSKKKAKAAAALYAPIASMSGICMRDGLILREKPENTATQVYRLMLEQEIKLLEKVQGSEVRTGGETLAGDWYLAMADDGTRGYVFSNQLALWDILSQERPKMTESEPEMDARLPDLFEQTWRPAYFKTMEASKRFDLAQYQPRFGLFADPTRKIIRVEYPKFSKVYKYESIKQDSEGAFILGSSGAKFQFTRQGDIVFTPPQADITPEFRAYLSGDTRDEASSGAASASPAAGASAGSTGKIEDVSIPFMRQKNDPRTVIASEERRRLNVLGVLVAAGERFESEQYGALIITPTARVTWVAYDALVPALIPADAGERAYITMNLYLSAEISASWQGACTINFDGGALPSISFAYRADDTSLTLLPISPGAIRSAVVQAVPDTAPMVFTRSR